MTIDTLYFAFPGQLETLTGGYLYDRRLIHELRQRGVRVETVALSEQFPFPDTAALREAHAAFAALPDGAVVIADGLAFGALGALAQAQAQRLRLIALCHHPLALESGLDRAQQMHFQASEQQALQAARAVLVTSRYTARLLHTQFAVAQSRVVVAPPGTDPRPFAPAEGQPPTLLTVASVTRRKAHDVLIDALAGLTHLPWQARFVGGMDFDPVWSQHRQAQVNRLRLQKRICFTGALDQLEAEFQQADVFVLPSRFEGYGMVFAEALAAGLPVVAARAGAVPDVVPETAGLLVPPDDATALTAALRRLLTDDGLRRRLQIGARNAAATLPTWAHTAQHVARLIEEVKRG